MEFLINVFELVALITAVINYNSYKKSTERFILPFLCFVVLVELMALIFIYGIKINATPVYNLYITGFFLSLLWWLRVINNHRPFKRSITVMMILYIISLGLIQFLQNFFQELQSYSFALGASLAAIGCALYLTSIINSNLKVNLLSELKFWIVTSTLLYSVGMVPVMLFFEDVFDSPVFLPIWIGINLIFFGGITFGLIWTKNR